MNQFLRPRSARTIKSLSLCLAIYATVAAGDLSRVCADVVFRSTGTTSLNAYLDQFFPATGQDFSTSFQTSSTNNFSLPQTTLTLSNGGTASVSGSVTALSAPDHSFVGFDPSFTLTNSTPGDSNLDLQTYSTGKITISSKPGDPYHGFAYPWLAEVDGSIRGTLDPGSRLFIDAGVVVHSDLTTEQSGIMGHAELSFWVTTPGAFDVPFSNIQLWHSESYLYDILTATSIVTVSLELELFGTGTVFNDPGSGVLTPLAVVSVPEPSSVVVAGMAGTSLIGGLAARRLAGRSRRGTGLR
jgi:hypothetical protein